MDRNPTGWARSLRRYFGCLRSNERGGIDLKEHTAGSITLVLALTIDSVAIVCLVGIAVASTDAIHWMIPENGGDGLRRVVTVTEYVHEGILYLALVCICVRFLRALWRWTIS